jgi:hypothetical protein
MRKILVFIVRRVAAIDIGISGIWDTMNIWEKMLLIGSEIA